VRTRAANSVAAATRLLRLIFTAVDAPLAVRLWDGTVVEAGASPPCATVVFRSRRVFRRLLAWPTPLRFGEAFIASDIDLEGDLFGALRATHSLEAVRWPLRTRLAMWRAWIRI
jgi:cyclopropane-fatty-acyl-phospholipid synthase